MERLVAFLYILLRDELPAGRIEAVLVDHVERVPPGGSSVFSNAHLESYARELAERLAGRLNPPPPSSDVGGLERKSL
jgi:hypothetical protein